MAEFEEWRAKRRSRTEMCHKTHRGLLVFWIAMIFQEAREMLGVTYRPYIGSVIPPT